MVRKICLSGEPKSTQHIYGFSCRGRYPKRFMTPEGKALKEQYQWEAKAQWKGKPLSDPVAADITLYFGTKRAADWDNFHKLSCDALSGIAYEDEKQIKRVVATVAYDKQNPRIELNLSEL